MDAWQESLAEGKERDVFVVPCTLSMSLVLEAETLIEDALLDEGKQRYIISDDEFSEPRTIATFIRRLVEMDAAIHVVFGAPLDVAGNLIDAEDRSLDPRGRPVDRRAYVVEDGKVVRDEQRDHHYTERLAAGLCDAYRRDFVVQSTHLAAHAAWEALRARHPRLDTWRLLRLPAEQRKVPRAAVEAALTDALGRLQNRRVGPQSAPAILDDALRAFQKFHRKRALSAEGADIRLSGELTLYYRNRLEALKLGAA